MVSVVCQLVLVSNREVSFLMLHDVPVDGCVLNMRSRDHLLIANIVRVVLRAFVSTVVPKSMSTRNFDLRATQHHSAELVQSFFEALRL